VSETPHDGGAPLTPAVSEAPGRDAPVDQPEAGDPTVLSASLGIPSPATMPAAPVRVVVQEVPTTTADPRVDDALSRLAEIDTLPLTEQVEVYTDIHRRLSGVLADPDSQA
jgi:hypothetical protein